VAKTRDGGIVYTKEDSESLDSLDDSVDLLSDLEVSVREVLDARFGSSLGSEGELDLVSIDVDAVGRERRTVRSASLRVKKREVRERDPNEPRDLSFDDLTELEARLPLLDELREGRKDVSSSEGREGRQG